MPFVVGTPFEIDVAPDDQPDAATRRGLAALQRLSGLWQGSPGVRSEVLDATLTADRAELERRALGKGPR